MVSDDELEGFRRDRYFARSWALLTRDRGWVKPVLLMTVALLVPIVGALGILGYALEWARLTAWNVNAAPKQRGVDVGACIKSGWRGFVVMLVWGIVSGVVIAIAEALPLIGALVSLIWVFASFVYTVVMMVASLRATIYQKIGAGLRVRTIWQMVRHDPIGLLRVTGLMSALSGDMGVLLVVQLIASLLSSLGPALVVLLLVDFFLATVLTLVGHTAVGLWMRQFDVPSWGRDEDPLPTPVSDPRDRSGAGEMPQLASSPVPADQDAEKNDEPQGSPADPGEADDGPVIDESR